MLYGPSCPVIFHKIFNSFIHSKHMNRKVVNIQKQLKSRFILKKTAVWVHGRFYRQTNCHAQENAEDIHLTRVEHSMSMVHTGWLS